MSAYIALSASSSAAWIFEGDLFAKGDRIVHKAFGPGVIEDIDADDKCYIIQFDRLDTQRRIAFRVKMERESV